MTFLFRKPDQLVLLADSASNSSRENLSSNWRDFKIVAGCLDQRSQKVVRIGEYYKPDECTICLCSPNQRVCHQVLILYISCNVFWPKTFESQYVQIFITVSSN